MFARLSAGEPSLEDFLGSDLIARFERSNLHRMKWFERRTYTLNCNWKVFVDNYLDGGYHVPHIHGGLSSVLDYSNYTIETGARFCLQSSPIITDKGEVKTAAVRNRRASHYLLDLSQFDDQHLRRCHGHEPRHSAGRRQDRGRLRLLLHRCLGTSQGKKCREYRCERADPERRCRHLRIGSAGPRFARIHSAGGFRCAARPASICSTDFCTAI